MRAWVRRSVGVEAYLPEETERLDNLVLCPCGHSLAHHNDTGCSGDRVRSCACEFNRYAALEAAVDSVRTATVYPSFSTRSDDAA